jgi:hypothetical protein
MRISWERVGVIVGVLAFLVGVTTWLLPDPVLTVCSLTSYRLMGCNAVPSDYLGTWRGRVTMKAALGTGGSGTDSVTIHRGRRGEGAAADQRAVGWRNDKGQDIGCSHMWRLESVQDDRISFSETETTMNDPTSGTGYSGCLRDVTLTVRLRGHDEIEITGFAGSSNPIILPPGTVVYQGTLQRLSAE